MQGCTPRHTTQDIKTNRRLNETFYVESCGFSSVSLILAGFQVGFFFREVHPGSEWLAKMAKTRQNENKNFQTITNRGDS